MDSLKIRVKVGQHEFEAEGPEASVTAQFEAWKQLVVGAAAAEPKKQQVAESAPAANHAEIKPNGQAGFALEQLAYIFNVEEKRKLVTLRALPTGDSRHGDAIILVLYGYRQLMKEDEILVTRLKSALQLSGSAPDRIDRAAEPLRGDGLLVKTGKSKGGRYRLTNLGLSQAEEMVRKLLQQLA